MAKIIGNTTATPINTYTKKEIDSKFGGVYRYCGNALVHELTYINDANVGDVYNIINKDSFTKPYGTYYPPGYNEISDDTISLGSIRNLYCYSNWGYMTIHCSSKEYADRIIYATSEGSCDITFINESKRDENGNYLVSCVQCYSAILGETDTDVVVDFNYISPNDSDLIPNSEDNLVPCCIDYIVHFEIGDNVAWNGVSWDKLSASVDTSEFATKNEVYTKSEVDSKFGGVYRYCGSATVDNGNIVAPPKRIGDVYNIATGGTISSSANVSIPFEIPNFEDNPTFMNTANVEDNYTLGVVASDPNNTVFIGQKGTGVMNPQAVIRITKVAYASDFGLELFFEYLYPPEDGVLDSENWEITGVEYKFDVKSGDNVVWNGKIWDILAGTVDLSQFATKDDVDDYFKPVAIFDGLGLETDYTFGMMWGAGGFVTQANYTAIHNLIDVMPNAQYRIFNFNGLLTFYNSEKLDGSISKATFESSSLVATEYTFTVPDGKYKMGLSMYQPQSLNDIKLYRISPIDGEEREKIYTQKDLIVGKDNFSDDEIRAFLPLYGKKIVNFGDSIFGMYDNPSNISSRLANLTGATVYNCGFAGSRLSAHTLESHKAFSMYKLASAVASGDFSEQETAIETYASTLGTAYANNLNTLKSIDFNKVDIVTIAYGTNDFAGAVPVDHDSYKTNGQIFAGALRKTIETLLNAYPNLQIFLCTPIFRVWYSSTGDISSISDDKIIKDSWGIKEDQKLTDFVSKIKEVGEAYHIPVIDNYYELGINLYNHKRYLIERDGTHPTGEGLELISRHIASKLF